MAGKDKSTIDNLLELPTWTPERRRVAIPRLGIVLLLEELSYDQLCKIRREREPNLHLILAAIKNHPEIRQEAWYHGKMGAPTPVEALGRLLRDGEIARLVRTIDDLNGYGPGSVTVLSDQELEDRAISKALDELEKN